MIEYRGYTIGQSYDRREALRTFIEAPNGDAHYTDRDPRDEVDEIVDGTETPEQTAALHEEWKRMQWELA